MFAKRNLPCPKCDGYTPTHVVSEIRERDTATLEALETGEINAFECEHCGHRGFVDEPLLARCRGFYVRYLPKDYLTSPEKLELVLAEMAEMDAPLLHVFHPQDILRHIAFRRAVEAHVESRRNAFENFEIPADDWERLKGSYKKSKLKIIAFVATSFLPNHEYSERDVDCLVRAALGYVPVHGEPLDVTYVRATLCDLGFLKRTPDGRKYWKA